MRTSRKIKRTGKSIFDLYLNEDLKLLSKETSTPLLYILTTRTVILLSLYLLASSLFYLIGNYQQFLDSDLRIILECLSITASALLVFSATGFLEAVFLFFWKLREKVYLKYIFHLIFFTFAFCLGFGSLMISSTLNLLSKGV